MNHSIIIGTASVSATREHVRAVVSLRAVRARAQWHPWKQRWYNNTLCALRACINRVALGPERQARAYCHHWNAGARSKCAHGSAPVARQRSSLVNARQLHALSAERAFPSPVSSDELHGGDRGYLLAQLLCDGHAHGHDVGGGSRELDLDDGPIDRVKGELAAPRARQVRAASCSSMSCSTSLISGIFSISRRWMPCCMVTVLDGQLPHAPFRRTRTTGPARARARERERERETGEDAADRRVCATGKKGQRRRRGTSFAPSQPAWHPRRPPHRLARRRRGRGAGSAGLGALARARHAPSTSTSSTLPPSAIR